MQMGLNEMDSVEWTEEAKAHYRLDVGNEGDGRYLRGFGGRERVGNAFRWSTATSYLILPVPVGKACTVTVEGEIPGYAVGADSGLYLGQTLLAPLVSGQPLVAQVPPTEDGRARLELRCQGWVPQTVIPGSNDPRTLGVQVQRVTVKAEGAAEAAFSANTGQWLTAEQSAN
jgi:hypothetical protein